MSTTEPPMESTSTFGTNKTDILTHTAIVCASVSFTCSCLVVAGYIFLKQIRVHACALVTCLAITDLGANVSYFFGNPDNWVACRTQSVLQQFFQTALIQWTVVMARSMYFVTMPFSTYNGDKTMPYYHAWCWSVATVSTILPATTSSYGPSGAWCWIKPDHYGTIWRLAAFYVPLWISMVYIIAVYVLVFFSLKAQSNLHPSISNAKVRLSGESLRKERESINSQVSVTAASTSSKMERSGHGPRLSSAPSSTFSEVEGGGGGGGGGGGMNDRRDSVDSSRGRNDASQRPSAVGHSRRRSSGSSAGDPRDNIERIRKFMSRVKWFPVIFMFCWTFASINRVDNIVDPNHPIFGLYMMQVLSVRLQGTLNAIVYGLYFSNSAWASSKTWREKIYKGWNGCWRRVPGSCCDCCVCKTEEEFGSGHGDVAYGDAEDGVNGSGGGGGGGGRATYNIISRNSNHQQQQQYGNGGMNDVKRVRISDVSNGQTAESTFSSHVPAMTDNDDDEDGDDGGVEEGKIELALTPAARVAPTHTHAAFTVSFDEEDRVHEKLDDG